MGGVTTQGQRDPRRRDYAPLLLTALSGALLLAGGLLYIGFRERTLVMFDWFSWLGVAREVAGLRLLLQPFKGSLPAWLYMSAPTTLWMLSGLSMLACVWRGAPGAHGRVWVSSFLGLSLSSEVLQLLEVVPGTFDPVDLAMMLVGLPVIVLWNEVCAVSEAPG